jgi:serine protease Do
MKAKIYLGALFMALFGAAIALFAYSKINNKPAVTQVQNSSSLNMKDAQALLTSLSSQEGQVDFTYAAEKAVQAVVHVHTKSMMGAQADNPILEWFYGDRTPKQREVQGFGSGVIISPDGYIITNNHVIENAEDIEVILNDNRKFNAKVVGRDPSTDIALLKINATDLPFMKYGDSDQLKVGEWVLAVGNPFNLTSTVTAGIVSAKGRSLGINEGDYRIESFIQTDAALNVGNSGGALVNTKGELVGITSAILSPSGAYAGNSFAIPINIAKKVVADLEKYGEVQRPIIGVNITEVTQEDANKYKLPEVKGALIASVSKDGSADAAGLKEHDVIVKFDGVDVNTPSELQVEVGNHRPGDKATITYLRNGKEFTVPITLKNIEGNTNIVTPGMAESGVVFGARLETLSQAEKNKLNIDYGVKVAEVNNGKFKDIGIKKGDVILNINGRRVGSAADVRDATDNESDFRSIEGVQSNGSFFSYIFK